MILFLDCIYHLSHVYKSTIVVALVGKSIEHFCWKSTSMDIISSDYGNSLLMSFEVKTDKSCQKYEQK